MLFKSLFTPFFCFVEDEYRPGSEEDESESAESSGVEEKEEEEEVEEEEGIPLKKVHSFLVLVMHHVVCVCLYRSPGLQLPRPLLNQEAGLLLGPLVHQPHPSPSLV